MTFLNDLWKKFKAPPATHKEWDTVLSQQKSSKISKQEDILNTYQEIETEELQRQKARENLKILKDLIDEPKEDTLGLRFSKIQEHLSTPESHETVRQERWPENIQCPNCQSKNLKRLPHLPTQSPHNHRYRCSDCHFEFTDESGTPLETGLPPLNIWMQCWYLMGCTDSLSYIAARLNLDLSIVERMAEQLRRIFNANKPLTRFLTFEEWNEQSKNLRKQLSEDLLKQYETLNANVATAPKDTTEFRRQQNLRRTLKANTDPPPSTTPTTRKKGR